MVYVHAGGLKSGCPFQITLQLIDYHDDETGFTAMERCTGFSAAIIAIGVANGTVPRGLIPYEQSMSGHAFVREFLRRASVSARPSAMKSWSELLPNWQMGGGITLPPSCFTSRVFSSQRRFLPVHRHAMQDQGYPVPTMPPLGSALAPPTRPHSPPRKPC